jgi:FxsC-like protein
MVASVGFRNLSSRQDPYFYLSYAHARTATGHPKADPDRWVKRFFRDLVVAVRRNASHDPRHIHGFMDRQVPPGADKEALSRALGSAQAFVPLYSASYLARSLPGRELAGFNVRAELAGVAVPQQRIVPVMWGPMEETWEAPGLQEALALDSDKPAYLENGLQALLKISSYAPVYHSMLGQLAQRIVVLAENSPIERSEVPDIDKIPSAFTPRSPLAVFAIEIAAPVSGRPAASHNPDAYGASPVEWKPFGKQGHPVLEEAAKVVERLDFKPEASEIRTVRDPLSRRPGIILIDPWFIGDENGRAKLASAVRDLPPWVLPLLILDQPGNPRAQELASRVRDILGDADALHTESSEQGARGVNSPDDFLTIMRRLVIEAETQYIRYRSGRIALPSSGERPRLRRRPPEAHDSGSNSLGVTPDA